LLPYRPQFQDCIEATTILTRGALPGRRRRRYSPEFKARIVETCNRRGTSVAAIARQHNINDNIAHRWIREAEQAASAVELGVRQTRVE